MGACASKTQSETDYNAIQDTQDNDNDIEEDTVTKIKTVKHTDKLSIFGYIRLMATEKYDLYIPPSIIDFIVLYTYFMTNLVQIPLKIQSHKGQYSNGWRVDYIIQADTTRYASIIDTRFPKTVNDWIIFEYDALYLVNKIVIRSDSQYHTMGVKTMKISIGNRLRNKWYPFSPNIINVAHHPNYQSFDIDGIDYKLIKEKKLKQIKVEFITNHGFTGNDSRFVVMEFQIHGLQL